jgi:O-antigen/teichoic acid export membrane protein
VEERMIRGIPWTLLSYAFSKLVTVLSMVVLARLLVPDDFGIVALATLAVQIFNVLGTFGLSGVLVVRQDLDRRGMGTILTLMLAFGALVALVLTALSPVIADLFDEPRLTGVLAALSTMVFLAGFVWFYETLMQRELEFRKRFMSLMVQSLVYASLAISLAALGAGVWSLVVGQIGGMVAFGIALWLLAPYRVRPGFDSGEARASFVAGRGFLLYGSLAVVEQNIDYIAVGRILGATQLGFYSVAYRIGELPYLAIADPVARVTFPGFARMRHRGEDVGMPFLSALRSVALVTCPLGVFVSAAADPFTAALFGDKWLTMIGPLSVLGLWAAVRPVQATIGWLLNSIGEAWVMAWSSVLVFLPLVPGLVVAAELGGITAVAWVMLADILLSLVILGLLVQRRGGVPVIAQWRAIMPVAVGCAGTWLVVWAVAQAMSASAPGLTLAACVVAAAATYAAAVSVVEPGLLRDALAQVKRALGRVPAPAARSR